MRFKTSALIGAASLGLAAFSVEAAPADAEPLPPDATTEIPQRAEDEKGIFNVVFENDIFGGTDQNYTNGIRFSYLSSEAHVPNWVNWASEHLLPVNPEGNKRISVALGQNMYTPDDPVPRTGGQGDRPYAGWLYGSVGVVSDTGSQLDNVMLTVGMVGPVAHAQQVQRFVHKVIDSPKFNGWDSQLENEPGIVLTFERKWRGMYQLSPFGAGLDATPHAVVNLGNVNTDASVGMTFRLGYDLPADYGPPRIRPSLPGSDFFIPTQELGGYLFAGFEGRAVGRNIFLDGNTFESNSTVDKEILIGGIQAGAALTYGNTRLSYTHVVMTREFEEQDKPSQFGVITLSYRF